jgi:hypothetical protein
MQISFNPHESNYVIVTGNDTYKYYKIEENEFEAEHTQLNNKDMDITTRYSCHCWMTDGRLIVCTEVGEIILIETDGSYLGAIMDDSIEPGFKIECVIPFGRGFIIAGNGLIYAFEKTEDSSQPYRLIVGPVEVKLETRDTLSTNTQYQITSMTLSHDENTLYFTTKTNQLLKVDIPLYDGGDSKLKFDFVHCCFHT